MPAHNLRPTGIGMALVGGLLVIVALVAGGSVLLIGGMALLGAGAFLVSLGPGDDRPGR